MSKSLRYDTLFTVSFLCFLLFIIPTSIMSVKIDAGDQEGNGE